jgi:hypothetical protein
MKIQLSKNIALAALLGACLVFAGCHRMVGTYSDPSRAVLLELKAGGKANFTFMGDVEDCTYSSSGTHLTLKCKGDAGTVVFTIHEDGSLTGPPGSFMPGLRKEK